VNASGMSEDPKVTFLEFGRLFRDGSGVDPRLLQWLHSWWSRKGDGAQASTYRCVVASEFGFVLGVVNWYPGRSGFQP
jgi:hypothetical protein